MSLDPGLGLWGSAVPQRTPVRPTPTTAQSPIAPKGLMHGLSVVGVLALLAVLGAQAVAPDVLQRASVGLAIVGILIGIPHGAVDHMVPFWTGATRPRATVMAGVLAQYVGIAAAAGVALYLVPDVAVTVFLIASALHFGWGEAQFARASDAGSASGLQAIRAIAHGTAVVVLPLSLWHHQAAGVLGPLAPWYAGDSSGWLLTAGAGVVLTLNAAVALAALLAGRMWDSAQTTLVVVVFIVAPPLAAFAVYFGFWHSLRHIGRVLALPGLGAARLSTRAAIARYAWHAALPTVAVAVALPIVWATGSRTVITSLFVLLLALTFPHMHTIAGLDRWAARNAPRATGKPGTNVASNDATNNRTQS